MFSRRLLVSFITGVFAAGLVWLLAFPVYEPVYNAGDNYYVIYLNETPVGALKDEEQIRLCLQQARRNIAEGNSELVLAASDLRVDSSYAVFGRVDDVETVTARMTQALEDGRRSTLNRSYTVKINEYAVNLASMDEVYELIFASKLKYDDENSYDVTLTPDPTREINVLTASIVARPETEGADTGHDGLLNAGFDAEMQEVLAGVEPAPEELEFEAFDDLGLTAIDLGDKVEIVESWLPAEELTAVDVAISDVTKDEETNKIYEVVRGDTLSVIADNFGLTVEDLIAMNPMLSGTNATIRPQDELIVTVPEPLLSVNYTLKEYVEENFNLPTEYVENDNWYQDETQVIRQGVTGHRRIIALTRYEDGTVIDREVVKEVVDREAVAMIVERGTKVRPTYVKPISGGVLTSGFGYRVLWGRAGAYHAGVDWGVPTGTAVFASCGGVVTQAGWLGGYGYAVYIRHPDGRETRYAHMSRVLVSPGDYVNQLDRIGLSGSTGDSTGPHLHFEIRIGGQAVNPLDYIEW